ncbi:MAG TPA: hypothetical protein VD816_13265 [Ohtaekwangia sp.]|nr:hypothetical protein [Ohtaekwangia sp.]
MISDEFPNEIDSDPRELRLLILEMARTIKKYSDNRDVNSLMDSLFNTLPIDMIRENLKMINDDGGITWIVE